MSVGQAGEDIQLEPWWTTRRVRIRFARVVALTALLIVSALVLPGGATEPATASHNAGEPIRCTPQPYPGTVFSPTLMQPLVSGIPGKSGYNPLRKPGPLAWVVTTPPECLVDLGNAYAAPAYGPAPSGSCPVLTVTGRFFTWSLTGISPVPMAWAEVNLWDIDSNGFGTFQQFVGDTMTDADGSFSISVCNRDVDPFGHVDRLDLVVQVTARSSAVTIQRALQTNPLGDITTVRYFVYSGLTTMFVNIDSSGTGAANIGSWIASTSGDLRWGFLAFTRHPTGLDAYGIVTGQGITKGWDFLANGPAQWVPGHVFAHYLGPCVVFTSCGVDGQGVTGEPYPHYMVAGGDCKWPVRSERPNRGDCKTIWRYLDGQIHLNSKNNLIGMYPIQHVYAHFVMQQLYGGWYPGVGPLHGDDLDPPDDTQIRVGDVEEPVRDCGIDSYILPCYNRLLRQFGRDVAWAEGWADYFATRVLDADTDSTYGVTRDDGSSWSVLLERPDTSYGGGDGREWVVAGAINDMFDPVVDGVDIYAGGFLRTFNAMKYQIGSSLQDYWGNWRALFSSDLAQVRGARLAIRQNTIEYWTDVRGTTNPAVSSAVDVAVDPSGNSHIVWTDSRDGNYEVYYRRVTRDWTTGVSDTRLTVTTPDASGPAVAFVGSSRVYVVWAENRGTGYDLYQRFLDIGTGSWSAEGRLVKDAPDSLGASIAGDAAGNVFYLWRDMIRGTTQTERVLFQLNTGKPVVLYSCSGTVITSSRVGNPDIALGPSGRIHAAFSVGPGCPSSDGSTRMYYSRFNGIAWESPRVLGLDVDYPRRIRVASDAIGHVYVAWDQWNNYFDLSFRKSDDNGVTWGTELVFGGASSTHQIYPDVGIGSVGEVYIAYSDNSAGQYETYFLRSTNYGGSFGPAMRLTVAPGDSLFPRAAGASGRVVTAWQDARDGNVEVYFAELSFAT